MKPQLPRRITWRASVLACACLLVGCSKDDPRTDSIEPDAPDVGDTDTAPGDTSPEDSSDCTAGALGCACAAGGECTGDLVCSSDICQEPPACTLGETGCECLADLSCTDPSDECTAENVCAPRASCLGELACACGEGDSCNDGLECIDALCRVSNGVILTLSGPGARACDLLIDAPDRLTAEVVYPAGVRGRHRARGARTAVSIFRTADEDLGGPVAAVVFSGAGAASAADVGAISATCYDRLGAIVPNIAPTAD